MGDVFVQLVTAIFKPPPVPNFDYPFLVRKAPGFVEQVAHALQTFYFQGVKDGFLAGAVFVLLLVVLFRTGTGRKFVDLS